MGAAPVVVEQDHGNPRHAIPSSPLAYFGIEMCENSIGAQRVGAASHQENTHICQGTGVPAPVGGESVGPAGRITVWQPEAETATWQTPPPGAVPGRPRMLPLSGKRPARQGKPEADRLQTQ